MSAPKESSAVEVADASLVVELNSTEMVGAFPPSERLGGWIESGFQLNVAYRAETDGFVAVHTGGNSPARGADIQSGTTPQELKTRTRAGGPYAGAVLPIAKGEYWLVMPQSSGSVSIQWRPANWH